VFNVHRRRDASQEAQVADDPIRIELERSGGFAGLSLKASVDTSQLPPGEAARIAELVDRVDFDALAARASEATHRAPDRFQYDLVVSQGGRRHELSLGESAVTPELRPLLDYLMTMAKGG
jgi:hypothetical protein